MKSKNLIPMIGAGILLASTTSFALVIENADCKTPDGKYRVTIQDNQGIGPLRRSHPVAAVRDENGKVVVTYRVQQNGPAFRDELTNGSEFELIVPGGGLPGSLKMKFHSGAEEDSVFNVNAASLNCSVPSG